MEKNKKETQDTFWYPPLEETLDQSEVWKKKEIGFYIHIPFCKTICKYCPFNKYAWRAEIIENYLDALHSEMKVLGDRPYIKDAKFIAGYLGGGTPTALPTPRLVKLIETCQQYFDIPRGAEISVEANPETVDKEKLETLLRLGVNRISLGVQTFSDRFLKMIGRFHESRQAIAAYRLARGAGHDNINIDLLYHLPGQTLEDVEKDLDIAIALEPDHITAYPLIISEGTHLLNERLAGKIPPQAGREIEDGMSRRVSQRLVDAGYNQYVVWDFALPGKECLHHKVCLEAPHREYIGLGAGAYSHIRRCTYLNCHGLEDYIQTVNQGKLPVSYGKTLTTEDEMHRFMVLGIYFVSVSKVKFRERFGVEMETVFGETIARLEALGWLIDEPGFIRLTEEGKIYTANVSNAFYSRSNEKKPHAIPVVVREKERGKKFKQGRGDL